MGRYFSYDQNGDGMVFHATAVEAMTAAEEALDLLIDFVPEGWPMPFGWNQVVAQARRASEG